MFLNPHSSSLLLPKPHSMPSPLASLTDCTPPGPFRTPGLVETSKRNYLNVPAHLCYSGWPVVVDFGVVLSAT